MDPRLNVYTQLNILSDNADPEQLRAYLQTIPELLECIKPNRGFHVNDPIATALHKIRTPQSAPRTQERKVLALHAICVAAQNSDVDTLNVFEPYFTPTEITHLLSVATAIQSPQLLQWWMEKFPTHDSAFSVLTNEAVISGDIQVVEQLLPYMNDQRKNYALRTAVWGNQHQTVDFLFDKCDPVAAIEMLKKSGKPQNEWSWFEDRVNAKNQNTLLTKVLEKRTQENPEPSDLRRKI